MHHDTLHRFRANAASLRGATRRAADAVLAVARHAVSSTPAAQHAAAPATAERLEGRQLLSSVFLENGVLNVIGDAGRGNTLTVDYRDSGVVGIAGGVQKVYARSGISSIRIVGGSGNDWVYVNPGITARATIVGNGGDDNIRSGGGSDNVDAGDGNDKVWSENGNDTVLAGNGNDYTSGGLGDDSVVAGAGNDYIYGNDGNDTLLGGDGDDKADGGNGNDRIEGGAGNDNLIGGGGTNAVSQDGGTSPTPTPTPTPTPDNDDDDDDDDDTETPPATPPTSPVATSSGWVRVQGRNADARAPQLVIQLLGQKIIAGQQAHVNALSGTVPTGSPLTAKYEWNFGDAGSEFNALRGWSAAHAYEKAGTYTVTLKVTDQDGRASTLSTTVTVAADTRRSIYVSANGNDANDGSSPDRAIKSVARVNRLIDDNVRILYRRGDTFNFASQVDVNERNVTIGAYGSGNRPVLRRVAGSGASIISVYQSAANVVVRDIVFDSQYLPIGNMAPHINAQAVFAGGTNVSVRGCEFRNVDYAVNTSRRPTGVLVQGNDAPLMTGVRGYLVWGEGSDHVYLGNRMVNSTREHCFRMVGVNRILVHGNDLRNADRGSVDGPDYSKGTIEMHRGAWAYIQGNKVADGALRLGPRGADSDPDSDATVWAVVEQNEVNNVAISIRPGTHNVMIRNNVIREVAGSAAVEIVSRDKVGRVVRDITIVNNTGYNPSSEGKFLRVDGRSERLTLMNNLFVMPNMFTGGGGTSSVYVADGDLSGFKNISFNVWQKPEGILKWAQGGVNWVRTSWGDPSGYKTPGEWDAYAQVSNDTFANTTLSGWTPSTSSLAANYAVKVPGVFDDFYGRARTDSRPTAGAVEI